MVESVAQKSDITKLRKRIKLFFGLVIILVIIIAVLVSLMLWPIRSQMSTHSSQYTPPNLEECIEKSTVIFYCTNEISYQTLKYRISKIMFIDEKVNFPYSEGELYTDMNMKVKPNIGYGEGRIVLLSGTPQKTIQSFTVLDGLIRSFDNISIEEFSTKVKSLKN